jgi:uncharacterized membrane protein YebE (DUF533 family)
MNTSALLDQILKTGREALTKGQDMAEGQLGVPASGSARDAMPSGLGKGAAAGGLLALLLGTKTGRKLGGSALQLGSLAALGGLAYKVYQDWQAKQQATAQPEPPSATPVDQLSGGSAELRSRTLLRALIAAAKADGHIESTEKAKLDRQIEQLNLDPETVRFVKDEIHRPLNAREVAAGADSPETALEIYTTSLFVIDQINDQERAYLDQLAFNLKLPAELVAEVEKQSGA